MSTVHMCVPVTIILFSLLAVRLYENMCVLMVQHENKYPHVVENKIFKVLFFGMIDIPHSHKHIKHTTTHWHFTRIKKSLYKNLCS